jgi:hypothetical protein
MTRKYPIDDFSDAELQTQIDIADLHGDGNFVELLVEEQDHRNLVDVFHRNLVNAETEDLCFIPAFLRRN